jgi:hypothetical protein
MIDITDNHRLFRRRSLAAPIALLAVIAVLSAAPRNARGQGGGLTAEVAESTPAVRSGAPVTVVFKIRSKQSGIQEGGLELVVRDGQELLARVMTDDVVLTAGEQLKSIVLPPLDTSSTVNSADMSLRFVGKNQTIELGQFPLRLANSWERSFVVAVCDPWSTNLSGDKRDFVNALRFESYNADTTDRTITTFVSHIRPDDMPRDPLACLGFDLAVLMNEGFSELSEAQLETLAAWIDAGGSACIVPGSQILKPHHLRFLNGLTDSTDTAPLMLDPTGRLVPPEDDRTPEPVASELPPEHPPAEHSSGSLADMIRNRLKQPTRPLAALLPYSPANSRLILRRTGLGRLVIIREDLNKLDRAGKANLRSAVAFLWRLRSDRIESFVATGKWSIDSTLSLPEISDNVAIEQDAIVRQYAAQMALQAAQLARMRPRNMRLSPVALQSGDELLGCLMPRDLRIIPLGIVGLILAAYVLTIGPVDYLVLGVLRRRRYTWLLFPLITIGFAVSTVWLSNWYMRVTDNRRSVTLFDVGERNVARGSRFEVLFHGTSGEIRTEVSRAMFAPMNHQQFSRGSWYSYQRAMARNDENQFDLVGAPTYSGLVPARYTVKQQVPQWTPQLNRWTQLAPEGIPPVEFDWSSLAAFGQARDTTPAAEPARRKIVERLNRAFGSPTVLVATRTSLQVLAGQPNFLQSGGVGDMHPGYIAPQPIYSANSYGLQQTTFMQDICTPWATGGLFDIVSRISPRGGRDFEDLAMLDPSDPREWLLIVAVEQGDELHIYRKLYRGDP